MGLFKGLQIGLDLGCSLNFKKKTELRKKIVENRGIISYIVTKNCHIVVTSDPEKCDVSSKCRMAIKYGLPVLRLDYIWDSLDADKLLPHDSYIVGGKSKILDFKSGKISAFSHSEKPKKYNAKPAFNPRTVKIWTANDINQPRFNEESHEVAKYAVFMGYSSSLKCQYTTILELHTPSLLSGPHDKSEVAMDDSSTENLFVYRVIFQSGCHKDLEAGKPCHTEIRYVTTAEQALAVFAMVHEDVDRKGELARCSHPVRGVGSQKLQKLMAVLVDVGNDSSDEVKELVDHVWREAMDEVTSVLGDISKIKLEQVEKAEAVLVKVRDALKASSSGKTIQNLIEDFYAALPHVQEVPNMNDTKRWLSKKQDMCQLIKDMMAVSEMTNYETKAYIEAKYAALRCRITHLSGSQKDDIVNLIKSSLESAIQNLHIVNVFEVWRWTEDVDFRHDLDRKELLFHSSMVENFVGILSRGLLLPKIVVDDFGGRRTDAGMLGSGIYFASAASKSMNYSSPSKTKGSRLLLVNEVALGSCKDIIKHDTTLVAPPEGYNSTHGVSRKWDKSSEFENDEFVVYSVNQQRIRYLVEFTMQEDSVRPLKKIDTVDTSGICDSVENASLQDVTGIADPMLKVKPGLIGKGGKEVELRCVHIRAKLVDLAAQVVVLQEYYNNSQQAIEAKYVFPLDDAAAVCGFEAFINGKHIIGEVKEKEVAHKEYQEAISAGHGAYLMDQDEETPDMFTVSVGNLPPHACVLIKIIYVAELQIEDEKISFLLPAAVAPWKEESALKLSTQEKLESYKMSATRTTVQVAVEMPFDIRSLHCPTHKIRVKQTASKAYVEMADNQTFGAGFQLLIGLAEIHVPRMWVERHSEDKEHQACMLTFYPEFESAEVADGELTLILDVSNSMKGTSLLEAKKVALLVLQNLPTGWSFNVARFGSDYEEVFPAPKRSTEENLQFAVQFVQNSIANKGNTDIMRLLKPLFLLPYADKQRNVFLISDGHINDTELVLHCAKQNSRHTRLFSFGVSATCNMYTLKAVSRVSGGAFEYFNSKTKSKWEPKVKSQISKACQPGLTSVNVEWHQYNDNLPAPVQAPQQITALFSGSHQIIYGFVPDCTMATLTAEVDGQKVSTVVSTSELSITEGLMVHRLTAKAIIRDWNDGILSRDRTKHEVAKMDLKNYIIDLSKEYSVVTQFTSFIAVEKREENEKDLPKDGPHIEELVEWENVDFLNYMGWTHIPEDDRLAILSVFDELSQEVNEQILSNKMICQLNVVEEKYKKLQQQMGPCDADVLTCARTLTQAYGLTGDTNRAANLAKTAYEEALSYMGSPREESDYTKLAGILIELKEKVLDFKEPGQTLMGPIPFPASGDGKIFIRTPAGSELTISCNNLLTVRQLKRLIQAQDNTPVHRQKLIFHGQPLKDSVSLEDLNIGYGDRIRLDIPPLERSMGDDFSFMPALCATDISFSLYEPRVPEQELSHRKEELNTMTQRQTQRSSRARHCAIPAYLPDFEAKRSSSRLQDVQRTKLGVFHFMSASALGWSSEPASSACFVPTSSAELVSSSSAELVPSSSAELVPSSSAETAPTGASYSSTLAAYPGLLAPDFAGCIPSNFATLSTDLSALPPASALSSRTDGFRSGAVKQAMQTGIIHSPAASAGFGAEKHSAQLTTGMPLHAVQASAVSGAPERSASFGTPESSFTFGGPLSKAVLRDKSHSRFGASPPSGFGAQPPPPPPPSIFGAPAPASFFGSQPPPGFGAPPPSGFGPRAQHFFLTPLPSGFGAPPSGFGAPTSGFGAQPPPGFGAPPPSGFGAPAQPDFGAPLPSGFGALLPSGFGAPLPSGFGSPLPSGFGVPPSGFGAQPGFGAPPPSGFGAPPQPDFGAPPQPDFGAPPQPDFGAPLPSGFGAPPPSGFKAPSPGFVAPSSSDFGAPETHTFGASSPSTSFGAPAPVKQKISLLSNHYNRQLTRIGKPAKSALFGALEPLGFEAIEPFNFEAIEPLSLRASPPSDIGTPAPPVFAVQEASIAFGRPTPSRSFKAPAPRPPSEASLNVVSQASSASIGGLFGSTPSAPAARPPSEASLDVVTQASSASVGESFGSTTLSAPAAKQRLHEFSTRFAVQPSVTRYTRLPLPSPTALTPSATSPEAPTPSSSPEAPTPSSSPEAPTSSSSSEAPTPSTAPEAPAHLEIRKRAAGRKHDYHITPVTQHKSTLKFGRQRQTEQMDEYLMNHSTILKAFKSDFKEVDVEKPKDKEILTSGGKESAQDNMRSHYAVIDMDEDLSFGEVMDTELVQNDLSPGDMYLRAKKFAQERRARHICAKRRKRHVSYDGENTTYEKMVEDSEYGSGGRIQSQFLDTDKSDLSPVTSGEKCIRARGVQLKVDDLDMLLDCQTEQGSWKLGDHLDQLLGISSQDCQRILMANGLRSLGRTASEHIEDLIATILVLFSIHEFLKPGWLHTKASAGTLSQAVDLLKEEFDEKTWRKFSQSYEKVQKLKEALLKAHMFCCKTERMHPCIYSILELGTNWVQVAAAFLQPRAT